MKVGTLRLTLLLRGSRSLKDKRQIVKSLKDRARQRFNVSIAEVDALDLWQRAEIGAATVSNEGSHARRSLEELVRFVESSPQVEVARAEIETD